ncbi:ABC-three component system middle component 6 [Neobacillus sp. SAB-20_R2A]|uniref:ABC-three component system middle component 6 n=1 Tax=Neobacillus sp. SAB-20_R2A TaxID=3120519 RepID=UPI003C6E13EC
MNFFLLSKHQTIEENVLVTSKILYELLNKKKHVDQLFLEFAQKQNLVLNLNIERVLYLSLTFLYSLDVISIQNNLVMRKKKNDS